MVSRGERALSTTKYWKWYFRYPCLLSILLYFLYLETYFVGPTSLWLEAVSFFIQYIWNHIINTNPQPYLTPSFELIMSFILWKLPFSFVNQAPHICLKLSSKKTCILCRTSLISNMSLRHFSYVWYWLLSELDLEFLQLNKCV